MAEEVLQSTFKLVSLEVKTTKTKKSVAKFFCFFRYDRHIAVAGASQLEIIDVTTNDVSCRLNDVNDINVIVWSEGRK